MTFITDPYKILPPETRWAPFREELGKRAYDHLIPPLVHKVRQAVKQWRDSGYEGVSESKRGPYICVETKGREDLDDRRKIERLKTWCEDVNIAQNEIKYIPLYVKEEEWEKYRGGLKKFEDVVKVFKSM